MWSSPLQPASGQLAERLQIVEVRTSSRLATVSRSTRDLGSQTSRGVGGGPADHFPARGVVVVGASD
jgi:hypothetical protein